LRKKESPEQVMSVLRERLKQTIKILEDPNAGKELKNSAIRGILTSCEFDKKSMRLQVVYRVFL
jgi:hypothetical protein